MAGLSRVAKAFVADYEIEQLSYEAAAEEAVGFVQRILAPLSLPIHVVVGRAKSIASVRNKLRRKKYPNPKQALTDLIGLRVIAYFAGDVDRVAEQLRAHLEISERKCRDARKELRDDQFGYRSVHLIARLTPGQARTVSVSHLQRRWFEIQVRSVLDHAWSEIEHEVVYKAGIEFPPEVTRRFRAVAGSLEVLEHAFATLAVERDALIERYKTRFTARDSILERSQFDVARLIAFLEIERPKAPGWRASHSGIQPLPAGLAVSAVAALKSAGLRNPSRLGGVFRTSQFRRMVNAFAAIEGIEPENTAHLALVVLAVATQNPSILHQQFPEMLLNPSIGGIIVNTRRKA